MHEPGDFRVHTGRILSFPQVLLKSQSLDGESSRNTRRLFMILSSIVLSGVLGAPTTQATDDKVFPASMCIRIFGSGGNPIYFGDARLFNSSTQPLTVICPIVRDSTLSPWTRIEVIAIDQHFQQNVSCRGHHLNRDGTSDFATAPTSTSFITGVTGQVLIIALSTCRY
jgi:hypothetical protein